MTEDKKFEKALSRIKKQMKIMKEPEPMQFGGWYPEISLSTLTPAGITVVISPDVYRTMLSDANVWMSTVGRPDVVNVEIEEDE